MYDFISGPLVWVAFAVFFGGLLYKFVTTYRSAKGEKVVLPTFSLRHGLRSLFHWIIPFRNRNTRLRPIFTLVSFGFHICLLATPLFLMAHNVLWRQAFGVSLPSMPDPLADVMTGIVILGGAFFFLRRLAVPVVRYVSDWKDFALLLVAVGPFVTGLLSTHQVFPGDVMVVLHILSGVLWLMVIPFTRIVHMLWFPFTRAFMGSEFGFVRHARDW